MDPHELCPVTDVMTWVMCKVPWMRSKHPAAARFQASAADLEGTLGVDSLLHRGVCCVVYGAFWVLNVETPMERLKPYEEE